MAGRVKDIRTVVTHAQLEARLQQERDLQAEATAKLLEKALGDFYQYLLEAGHLRPTVEADAVLRQRIDNGELRLPKPALIVP